MDEVNIYFKNQVQEPIKALCETKQDLEIPDVRTLAGKQSCVYAGYV